MKRTYIVAVSGGVDSVVLLHKLVSKQQSVSTHKQAELVVAHFDHGIRPTSAHDAVFVSTLSKAHNLRFECERAELGEGASEDIAREHRYRFLRALKMKYTAEAIITAHHQDDVLESMVIAMLRKSGVRSFVGYGAQDILRPLLHKPKSELIAYAKEHDLQWREDATNDDVSYLRNYVRKRMVPVLEPFREELLAIRSRIEETISERDMLAKHLLVQVMQHNEVKRALFLQLPYAVQKEVFVQWLRSVGMSIDPAMVERGTLAVKLMKPGKHLQLGQNALLYAGKNSVLLKVDTDRV